MADRYKVIAEQDYADYYYGGMPVALIKSRMLFDNDTQKVVTQIKLMSITDSVIDTVYASLKFYDVAGAIVTEINEHIMSMLDINENQTFGEKFPAYITDTRAARVDVSINKVVFKSGNVWKNAENQNGVEISPAAPVDIKPNLKERFMQTVNSFNVRANCRYEEFDNCKRCSCGFLDEKEAAICRSCGAEFDNIRKCFSENYLIESIYNEATQKMSSVNISSLKSAAALFEKIPDYNDSADKLQKCRTTLANLEAEAAERKRFEAEKEEADRKAQEAAIEKESRRRKKRNILITVFSSLAVVCVVAVAIVTTVITPSNNYNKENNHDVITAGHDHTVGLKSDGTVICVGDNSFGQRNVSDWSDIIAITAGTAHTVGLKSDGTVVAVGNNHDGQCNVSDWSDIIAVEAGSFDTFGLKSDGTVVVASEYAGYGQCNVSDWSNIIAITAGTFHTVGLKSDGTVVIAADDIIKKNNIDVSDWSNIIFVEAGHNHTVGLKSDGTVVAVGDNKSGQCNVSNWSDIIAIASGERHTVGLKSDGTVVAVGDNEYGDCNVSDWSDIVAIAAFGFHTVGLKSDGTVVAVGDNRHGQSNVSDWSDIMLPN